MRKLGPINKTAAIKQRFLQVGAAFEQLATSGSVSWYLLPTEVARWFAKAPSTVSRVWMGHQDTEQDTRRVGRGGAAGQHPNKRTTI